MSDNSNVGSLLLGPKQKSKIFFSYSLYLSNFQGYINVKFNIEVERKSWTQCSGLIRDLWDDKRNAIDSGKKEKQETCLFQQSDIVGYVGNS